MTDGDATNKSIVQLLKVTSVGCPFKKIQYCLNKSIFLVQLQLILLKANQDLYGKAVTLTYQLCSKVTHVYNSLQFVPTNGMYFMTNSLYY